MGRVRDCMVVGGQDGEAGKSSGWPGRREGRSLADGLGATQER